MRKNVANLKNCAILQIIPHLDAGGAEKTTVDIAKSIVAASGQSFVACNGGRLVEDLVSNGTRFNPRVFSPDLYLRVYEAESILQKVTNDKRIIIAYSLKLCDIN